LSIWFYTDAPSFVSVIDTFGGVGFNFYSTTCIILIVVSVLVIVVTFFGCCGAARDQRCMLWTYFVFVVILLVCMGVGAYFVFSGNTAQLKQPFIASLEEYNPSATDSPGKALVTMWDQFQQDYQCCGVDDWKDWRKLNPYFKTGNSNNWNNNNNNNWNNNNNNWNSNGNYNSGSQGYNGGGGYRGSYGGNTANVVGGVPLSCCDPSKSQSACAKSMTSSSGLYDVGCYQMVVNEVDKHSYVIGIVVISVFVALLINALIAIYMATCGYHSSRPKYRYGRAATA